jgi:methylmalonyl-CoA/ethylmalonyl-CoA epimerase
MSDEEFSIDGLHQIALGSSDLARSIEFYRDSVGAEILVEFGAAGLAFFRIGEVRLLLEQVDSVEPGSGALYLQVSDVFAAHDKLRARGVVFDSKPHLIHRDAAGHFGDAGSEEWMAFFRDPDGNTLALAARIPAHEAP